MVIRFALSSVEKRVSTSKQEEAKSFESFIEKQQHLLSILTWSEGPIAGCDKISSYRL